MQKKRSGELQTGSSLGQGHHLFVAPVALCLLTTIKLLVNERPTALLASSKVTVTPTLALLGPPPLLLLRGAFRAQDLSADEHRGVSMQITALYLDPNKS